MKSWTYFISIPLSLIIIIAFWRELYIVKRDGTFDALIAWIITGIIAHSAFIGLCYHAYRTEFGSWIKYKRKKK